MANKLLKFFNKIFKHLTSMQTIMLTRFCCGLYYKISSNEIINIIAKVYCVACAIFFYTQMHTQEITVVSLSTIFTVVFYNIFVMWSLVGPAEDMRLFLSELERVDEMLDVALDTDVPVARILFLGVLLERAAATTVWCMVTIYSCRDMISKTITNAILIATIEMSGFTRIMKIELTLNRVKALRTGLKNRLLASRLNESDVAKEIKHCMMIYKSLLDMFKNTATSVKIMISMAVVFVVLKTLLLVYMLHAFELFGNISSFVVDSFITGSLLLLPGVLMSLISREVNGIKVLILKQLFVCKGEATNLDLNEAIEDSLLYIKQRPLKVTVWGLFDVDMTMILGVLGLAFTCCLAMVQFGHFYV